MFHRYPDRPWWWETCWVRCFFTVEFFTVTWKAGHQKNKTIPAQRHKKPPFRQLNGHNKSLGDWTKHSLTFQRRQPRKRRRKSIKMWRFPSPNTAILSLACNQACLCSKQTGSQRRHFKTSFTRTGSWVFFISTQFSFSAKPTWRMFEFNSKRYVATYSTIFVIHSDELLRSETQCKRTWILHCTGERLLLCSILTSLV